MKKSAILSLLLIVSAGTTFTRAYTVQIGNLHYMIDQNKLTAEVVCMPNYEKYYGDISIPESVEFESHTYNVIAIGDMAFKQCYGLTSVELPNSIISIGESAFEYCEALKSIVIPDNVTSIGNYAFWECLGMTSVMIGSGVTSIGKSAFYKCISVESFVIDAANTVYDSRDNCNALIESATNTLITGCKNTRTIPDGITSIQDGAFADCSELESIEFPNSLRSIGTQVFWGCTGLKSIIVPVNLTSLGSQPFYGCTGITSVTWNAKNCPNSGDFGSQVESFQFGDEVESIPVSCCSGMNKLTSITIPNSVTSIGERAFDGCSGLTTLTISDNIACIENYVFRNCSSLTEVTIPSKVTNIGAGAFRDCNSLTSLTFPRTIASIGEYAFASCYSLKSIEIPNTITSIEEGAFAGCIGLTSITIPTSLTKISRRVFSGCNGLKTLNIPNNIVTIELYAFTKCSELESITLGAGLRTIEDYAFNKCKRIMDITVLSQRVIDITKYSFSEIGNKEYVYVYVPDGSLRNYQRDTYWNEFDLKVLGATTVTDAEEDVVVTPDDNSANITWPQITNAASYELVIRDAYGTEICTLVFNSEGYLVSITLAAPARRGKPQMAQSVTGFSFTVTSLNPGSTYAYLMTAKDDNGTALDTKDGFFTTTGSPMSIETIDEPELTAQKLLLYGHLYILRDGKIYTPHGARVE